MIHRVNKAMILLLTLTIAVGGFDLSVCAEPAHKAMKESDLPLMAQVRDPFWVRAYVPPEALRPVFVDTNAPTGPSATPKWPVLEPTGFLNSPKGDIVIIRGIGMAEEGQNVTKIVGSLEYVFKITKIKASEKKLLYEKVEARPPRPVKVVRPDKIVLH